MRPQSKNYFFRLCMYCIGIYGEIHCILFPQDFLEKSQGFNLQMGP